MGLSAKVQEALTEIFVEQKEPESNPAWTVRVGGSWFCPADATRMEAVDGYIRCPSCGKELPRQVVYQLIELHPHGRHA